MKQKTLLFILFLLSTLTASAQTWSGDIYYDLLSRTEAQVTYYSSNSSENSDAYRGSVHIPSYVSYTYNNESYTAYVTKIGNRAFHDCINLYNVTISDGIKSIESGAFSNCSSLTSITIPGSVTSITSAFYNCYGLKSITVDSNNTVYDSRDSCNAIIETLSNTLIVGCETTVIPNSVTEIGSAAFDGRKWMKSITIPNSVTTIGEVAFRDCSKLASLTIGSNVTDIGTLAFSYCGGLKEVYCYADNIPETSSNAFKNSSISSATLYVPKASVDAYKSTEPWSGFGSVKELPDTKCATPTIALVNGKCVLNCETEDVKYICNIEFENNGNVISLPSKVKLSVYATKDGLEPSDRMVLETSPKVLLETFGDMNGDGEVNMSDVMFIVQKILNGKFPDE